MIPFIYGGIEKQIATAPAALVNGGTVFTITGGPIQVIELVSVCTVTNVGTATTIRWSLTPAVGTATTFSGATASMTSCDPGSTILLTPTALSTAPTIVVSSAGGVQLGLVAQNHIILLNGVITTTVTNILSTARWYHCLRYKPLHQDSQVA